MIFLFDDINFLISKKYYKCQNLREGSEILKVQINT